MERKWVESQGSGWEGVRCILGTEQSHPLWQEGIEEGGQ